MERDFWMAANKKITSWFYKTVFCSRLTKLNLLELEHENKGAKLGGDYEFIKLICKL